MADISKQDRVPCPTCGYDLYGQVELRCPECGLEFVGLKSSLMRPCVWNLMLLNSFALFMGNFFIAVLGVMLYFITSSVLNGRYAIVLYAVISLSIASSVALGWVCGRWFANERYTPYSIGKQVMWVLASVVVAPLSMIVGLYVMASSVF